MQRIFDFLRYGSAHFTYIISSFLILSTVTKLCTNTISFLSFAVISLILMFFAVPGEHCLKASKKPSGKAHKFLMQAALLTGTALETGVVLRVFQSSSDNATTNTGAYVFAIIICVVSFICALNGSYTVLKLSNIIFIIPLSAFIVSLFGFVNSGISFEALRYKPATEPLKGLIFGTSAALLTFSDAFIISFMQKKENCYNLRICRLSYATSLCFVIIFTLLYKMMFGNEISSLLDVPVISAVGIISGFDLEEVFLFVYSISLLFRFSCRICAVKDILEELKPESKRIPIITIVFFIVFSLLGAASLQSAYLHEWTSLAALCTFLLAFVILPLKRMLYKAIRS